MKRIVRTISNVLMHSLLFLAALTAFFACEKLLESFTGPGVHVLFIGNSLTY